MLTKKDENKLTTMVNDLIINGQYTAAKNILSQVDKKEYVHYEKYMNMLHSYQNRKKNQWNTDEYSPHGV